MGGGGKHVHSLSQRQGIGIFKFKVLGIFKTEPLVTFQAVVTHIAMLEVCLGAAMVLGKYLYVQHKQICKCLLISIISFIKLIYRHLCWWSKKNLTSFFFFFSIYKKV